MGDRVAFQLGPYERSRPLTIDPIVLVVSDPPRRWGR